jgi:predicted permease
MAMRRALGAAQSRLVRQLFTEVAVLSFLGAAAGFALAHGGVAIVDWLTPTHLPRQSTIRVTGTVAAFTAVVGVLVSIIFALLPAFADRRHTHESLRAGRVTAQGPGMRRMQRAMVVAEVALSIVPLVAAGLMLRSFVNLTHAPIGFNPDNVLTAKVAFQFRAFPEPADRWRLYQRVFERVRQMPGVVDVSGGAPLPFDAWQQTRPYGREGETLGAERASLQSILPGYLRVTGTRLLAGREFTDDDIDQERPVVIVDERIARRLWPGGAVGQRLAYPRGKGSITLEVIGVSEPVRVTRVRDDNLPPLFIPLHVYAIEQALVIKTRESAAALAPRLKEDIESLGTRRPVYDIRPLSAYVAASMGDTRFLMLILAAFALASILLAAIGLYGTLAYLTSQRTQEFGIRMALGASAWRVLRSVAREGLVLAVLGAAIGFAGAVATTETLRGLLYDVAPLDGVTLTGVAVVVALTALVAASHPAWRAATIQPAVALRSE